MDKHFQEIKLVWTVTVVAKTEIARSLMKNVKMHLDDAVSKIPNVLVSESVIEAWQINEEETK
jgi:hypothetical protein